MDYDALAAELMDSMQAMQRTHPHRGIDDALRGEAFILSYLAGQGGVALPGEISGKMHVTSARVASALHRLKSKGLITRQTDTADRRKIFVRLTPKGTKLAEEHRRVMADKLADMLKTLGERDAGEYVRIMGKLAGQPHESH